MRFQKRIKLLPGISLNLSKSGLSVSAGPRGAKINIGKRGATATGGLPGTGISHTQRIFSASPPPTDTGGDPHAEDQQAVARIKAFFILAAIALIFYLVFR